jgi:DNA-binding NarL/FixJ family response regulator
VVVSPRALFAEGIQHILARRPLAVVVGVGSSCDEASTLVRSRQPDVVLIDLDSVASDEGGAVILALMRASPRSRLVALEGSRANRVSGAFARGGVGVLLPRASGPQDLFSALAANADSAPGGRRSSVVVAGSSEPRRLTVRQLTVLRLAARGLTNNQIAILMGLSPGTVKRHLYNSSRAIAASGRMDAINRARALGYEL